MYTRAAVLSYLTALAGMLLHYKREYEIHILDDEEEGDYTCWENIFQFSTIAFLLLWFYHLVCFVSSAPPCYLVSVQD